MKGLWEISAAAIVGFTVAGIAITHQQPHGGKEIDRTENQEDPVALSTEAEDTSVSFSWGLKSVHSDEARMLSRGNKDVVVAVIDTGCDVHHPDLSQNVWRNPGESGLDVSGNSKSSNGVDDDENGFVDDVYGWNFAGGNADVDDLHGHGTHISGIIASKHFGVAPDTALMVLKYYDAHATGADNLKHTIDAIYYAVRNGAKIINYSGGGLMRSPEEEEALRWAEARGVLVVAAAGNEGTNSDFDPFYPADYELSNILSVAAIDRFERLLPSSNFGIHSVDLAAPGKNIFSTLPHGQYGYLSGTSQATAFVSGAAALMMANDSEMRSPQLLIARLLEHTDARSYLQAKTRSGGLLDLRSVLTVEPPLAEIASTHSRAPARAEN